MKDLPLSEMKDVCGANGKLAKVQELLKAHPSLLEANLMVYYYYYYYFILMDFMVKLIFFFFFCRMRGLHFTVLPNTVNGISSNFYLERKPI